MPSDNLRFAVLIDADNAPRDCLKNVMEEIAVYGTPTVKRIYGDWTSSNVSGWKNSLLENAVTPMQQYGYTTGKNSTDSAMIIDAMDILYTGQTDGFVLVSSDSDFTRLALRLREAGKYVIGIGERKTPMPFIVACDKFIYIEVIRERAQKTKKKTTAKKPAAQAKKKAAPKTSAKKSSKPAEEPAAEESVPEKPVVEEVAMENGVPEKVIEDIADSVADLADDDGFVSLSSLGNLMIKKQPDFDPRNFGYSKLSVMMKALSRFEVDERPAASDPLSKLVYIRDLDA